MSQNAPEIKERIKYQKILENILNEKLKITNNLMNKTEFSNADVENQFEKFKNFNFHIFPKLFADLLVICSYFMSIFFIIFTFNKTILLIICGFSLILSTICIILSNLVNERKLRHIFDHLNIFFLTISLFLKGFFVNLLFSTAEHDRNSEILRIIIYSFISVNLLIYIKFESSLFVSFFYFFLNFLLIIITIIQSEYQKYFYLEVSSSILLSMLFYSCRKIYDYDQRLIFQGKLKFENFSEYICKFLSELNYFQMNFNNKELVYYDSRLNPLFSAVRENKESSYNKSLFVEMNKNLEQENLLVTSNISNNITNDKMRYFYDITSNFIAVNEELFKNEYEKDEKKSLFEKIKGEKSEEENTLLDVLNKLKNTRKMIDFNSFSPFEKIGIFQFIDSDNKKYYEIHHKVIFSDEKNLIYDLVLNDVTELIVSKIVINKEQKYKERIIGMFFADFKNSIDLISRLINKIKQNNEKMSVDKNEYIIIDDTISNKNEENFSNNLQNLNNIVDFLDVRINDLILFLNIKDAENLNFFPEKINIRELAYFSYNILKSLINSNITKLENVKVELNFQNILDKKFIFLELRRLKQIIINLVSNSVKFTRNGKIKLDFSYIPEINSVKIQLKDSGVGMKDEIKQKLFNYLFLSKDCEHYQFLSLGVQICKYLVQKMNLKINFETKYGEGSAFFLTIPVKNYNIGKNKESSLTIFELDKINLKNTLLNYPIESSLENKHLPNSSVDMRKNNSYVDDYFIKIKNNSKKPKKTKSRSHPKSNTLKNNSRSMSYDKNNSVTNDEIDNIRNSFDSNKINVNSIYTHDFSEKNISKFVEVTENPVHKNKIKKNFFQPENSDRKNQYVNKSNIFRKIEIIPNKISDLNGDQKILDFNKILLLGVNDNDCSLVSILNEIICENLLQFEMIKCKDLGYMIDLLLDDQNKENLVKCVFIDEKFGDIFKNNYKKIVRNIEKENFIKKIKMFYISDEKDLDNKEFNKSVFDKILIKPITKITIYNCMREFQLFVNLV